MSGFEAIEFGAMAPDQPDFTPGALRFARNLLPVARGYQALPELNPYSGNGIDARCLGAFAAKDRDKNSYNYAGDATKLYRLVGLTWTDSTRTVGGAYTANRWEFNQFNQQIVANNIGDDLQVIAFGGTNFANLAPTGGPIKAAHAAVVNQGFLMCGNLDDSVEGLVPQRVRWSAFGNLSDWTPSAVTQAGQQDLLGNGGDITRIVAGEFGLIFQERSIWRASYIRGNLIWQFDEVDPGIGTRSPGSVVRHGYRTYFLSEDGFRVFQGASSAPIGEERVDRTVLADIDTGNLNRVTAVVDTDKSVIYWAYPGPGAVNGTPNRLAIYNADIDRWSVGDEAVDQLYRAATSLTDVDDAALNAQYANTDEVPGGVDDHLWTGGFFEVAAVTPDGRLQFLTGAPRDAEIETSEYQLQPGYRSFVSGVRPVVDGGETSIAIGYRSRQSDAPTVTAYAVPGATGWVPHRVDARYMRFFVRVSGDFTDVVGLVPEGQVAGVR